MIIKHTEIIITYTISSKSCLKPKTFDSKNLSAVSDNTRISGHMKHPAWFCSCTGVHNVLTCLTFTYSNVLFINIIKLS